MMATTLRTPAPAVKGARVLAAPQAGQAGAKVGLAERQNAALPSQTAILGTRKLTPKRTAPSDPVATQTRSAAIRCGAFGRRRSATPPPSVETARGRCRFVPTTRYARPTRSAAPLSFVWKKWPTARPIQSVLKTPLKSKSVLRTSLALRKASADRRFCAVAFPTNRIVRPSPSVQTARGR
jgi:hypothetical protein